MSHKLLGVYAAFWLTLIPTAGEGQGIFAPAPAQPQTRDRLSQDRMDELVSGPIAAVQSDGLAAGRAAFDRLLVAAQAQHGARSVEVADLTESFGVELYSLGSTTEDRPMKEAAIPYLAAAVPAYRAAFGDAHPEVAVALTSYADAQRSLNEDDPPRTADAAYEEAYRILLSAFGPANFETLAALRYLARLRGLPSRTHHDAAGIEASAALFRQLTANSSDDPRLNRESRPYAHTAFARMYARNGMAAEARDQLRLGIEHARGWGEEERCLFAATETADIEDILAGKARGTGESLLNLDAISRCSDPQYEPVRERPAAPPQI